LEKIDKTTKAIIGGSLYSLFLLEQLITIELVTYIFVLLGLLLSLKYYPILTVVMIILSITDPFKLSIIALIFRALALACVLSIVPLKVTLLITLSIVFVMIPFESFKVNLNAYKDATSIREYTEKGFYASVFRENISLAYLSLLGLKVGNKLVKLIFLLLIIISGSQTVLVFYIIGLIFEFKSLRFFYLTILVSVGVYIFYIFFYGAEDNSFLSSRGGMFISLIQVFIESDNYHIFLGWHVSNDEFFDVLKTYSDLPPILIDDKSTDALGDVYWFYVLVRGGLFYFTGLILISIKVFGSSMRFFMLGFFNQFLMDRGFQVFSAYGRTNNKQ
jgi:hypothetical protein